MINEEPPVIRLKGEGKDTFYGVFKSLRHRNEEPGSIVLPAP